jgi:thiol-disulfide isomerase/thioredoxin
MAPSSRSLFRLLLCGVLVCGAVVCGFPAEGSAAPAGKLPEVVPADIGAVMAAVRRPGARAVLVNVWATWCEPCVTEMPDILKFYRTHRDRGLRLILVSADFSTEKKPVATFLASLGVDFRTYLKSGDDQSFIDGLDRRWNGTLPASLLFDGSGQRQRLWSGPVTYEALAKELEGILTAAPEPSKKDSQAKRRTP